MFETTEVDRDHSKDRNHIDIFCLKVLALLMCRGTLSDKAESLFELLIGSNGESYV